MSSNDPTTNGLTWGYLEERDVPESPGRVAPERCFSWMPRPDLARLQRTNLEILFYEHRPAEGLRQLVPPLGVDGRVAPMSFWHCAFQAGLEIRCAVHPGDAADLFTSYETMWYLFRHAQRMNEAIDRQLFSDLANCVRRGDLKSVLPWNDWGLVERTDDANRLPTNLVDFLDYGGEEALRTGIEDPDFRQKVSWGMARAARTLAASPLSTQGIRETLAYFLFSDDDFLEIDEDIYETVKLKASQTIQRRLKEDTSQAEVENWLLGNKGSFVGQIAKLKAFKELPNTDRRAMVRRALLRLGFEAYTYVGQCIYLLANDVAKCMEPSLSERELEIHAALFKPQPYLAEVPLILLADKMHWLESTYWPLTSGPSDADQTNLHHVMQFYGAMVRQLQRNDRCRKEADVDRPTDIEDASTGLASGKQESAALGPVFEKLRRDEGWACDCTFNAPAWDNSFEQIDESTWRLSCRCEQCHCQFGPIELSVDRLRDLGELPQ